ncbi:MAG: EamA family transporter [Firmicutes bacterium]|nr:EamA family transporter [Bacillota bacterium]
MAVVFALVTALAYGTGDFLAGFASRRAHPLAVAFLAQLAAVASLAVAVTAWGVKPSPAAIGWGSAAGAVMAVAFGVYLRGMAAGQIGVVATMAAVWSAVVPFSIGLALGERPSLPAMAGAIAVLLSVPLMSALHRGPQMDAPSRTETEDSGRSKRSNRRLLRPGLIEGLLAGVLYGTSFLLFDLAGSGGALWPVLAASATSGILLGTRLAATRPMLSAAAQEWAAAGVTGVLHSLATVSFILASQSGMLSLAAVVAALAPAPTIVLARFFLNEMMRPAQIAGAVLALFGIALIAAG